MDIYKEVTMEEDLKEVYFHEYCPKCAHKDLKECETPCYDCLAVPANTNTHEPVCYKEA